MEVEKAYYAVLFYYSLLMCFAYPTAYDTSTWIAHTILTLSVCRSRLIPLNPEPNPKPAPLAVVLNSGIPPLFTTQKPSNHP